MDNNEQIINYGQDEIDIIAIIRKVWDGRKFILRWILIAAFIAIVVIISTPKEYSVIAKLAPESISRTSSSSLSSLASLAGVNLSTGTTRDAVSPELYPDIVVSTPFLVDLFDMPVEIRKKGEIRQIDLQTYMREYQRRPWWSSIFSFPFKAFSWTMNLFRKKDYVPTGDTPADPTHLTRIQSSVANGIAKRIKVTVDSKTYQVKIAVEMQNPQVATDLCALVLDNLKSYITKYRTDKSIVDQNYTQIIFDEAREEYYKAQQAYADYMDANQNIIRYRVLTEQERLQNEMNLAYQLYNASAQQLQTAKARVQQETPVFAVLQPATYPLHTSKPSKMMTLVLYVFIGFFASAAWLLLFKDLIIEFKKK